MGNWILADLQGKGRLGEGRDVRKAYREGRCGKLHGRIWKRGGGRGSATHSPRRTLTARQLALGRTEVNSSLVLTHPSCNKYAPAECSLWPIELRNGSVAVISQHARASGFHPQHCILRATSGCSRLLHGPSDTRKQVIPRPRWRPASLVSV